MTPFLRLGTSVSVERSLSCFRITGLTFIFGALTLPYCNAVASMLNAQQDGVLVASGVHFSWCSMQSRTYMA